MQNKLIKNISPPFVIILILGFFLLTISLLFEKALTHVWSSLVQVIGVSFIAVSLTAPISDYFQFKTLSGYMGLLRGTRDSGIVHVFKSRKASRAEFQEALESVFAEADEIMMAGVGFPKILQNAPLPPNIDEKMFNPNIPLKILILDPASQSANERADIEIGRGTLLDIHRCIENLGLIAKERAKLIGADLNSEDIGKKIKMEIHTYDFVPVAFIVMTEAYLFLEQYHFGRLPDERPGECIGGLTPIIQFESDSTTYQIIKKHFQYIWDNKSKDITPSLLK